MRWSSCFRMQRESLAWDGRRENPSSASKTKEKNQGKPDLDLDNHVAPSHRMTFLLPPTTHSLHKSSYVITCVDQCRYLLYSLQASGRSMTELDSPLFIPPEDEGFPLNGEEDEVATSRLLHSPPRKRSRNLFEKPEVMKLPKCDASEIVRDEDYYFSDGSCIILVENTLFNVSPLVHHSNCHLSHPFRYTEQLFRRIPLPSTPCFLCPKETNKLRASRMTTRSFSQEIQCLSSGTSSGRCMPCELWKLVLVFHA